MGPFTLPIHRSALLHPSSNVWCRAKSPSKGKPDLFTGWKRRLSIPPRVYPRRAPCERYSSTPATGHSFEPIARSWDEAERHGGSGAVRLQAAAPALGTASAAAARPRPQAETTPPTGGHAHRAALGHAHRAGIIRVQSERPKRDRRIPATSAWRKAIRTVPSRVTRRPRPACLPLPVERIDARCKRRSLKKEGSAKEPCLQPIH